MKYILFVAIILAISCQSEERQTGDEGMTGSEMPTFWTPDKLFPEIYAAIQLNQVFDDPMVFADAVPKQSAERINRAFNKLSDPDIHALKDFAITYFELPERKGRLFETRAGQIEDHIESLWPLLTYTSPQNDRSTLIHLPEPYVIPNGISESLHYRDSYFAMLGMSVQGQVDLMENTIKDLAYLIETFGYIPSQNRNYMLTRSAPPYFASMVQLLAQQKGNGIYRSYIESMRQEYLFWMDGFNQELLPKTAYRRLVKLYDNTVLNRYADDGRGPRTEAFLVDSKLIEESGRKDIDQDIRAAAESGWVFSARWNDREIDLKTIRTTKIIPVDLNALLYQTEIILSQAYEALGDTANQILFERNAAYRKTQIQEKCWDDVAGYYMDYDWERNQKTGKPSLAGMFPLFCKLATQEQAERAASFVEKFLLKPGGVAPSIVNTGLAWDNPFGYAPLHYITIQGLRNYGLNSLADQIESRWMRTVEDFYRNNGRIIERYNVMQTSMDVHGTGYPFQDGFGWTNGVYLALKLN